MKKAILYELKRNLLPLCIFTALATAIFVVFALTTDFVSGFSSDMNGDPLGRTPINPLVEVPGFTLGLLCVAVPVMQFAYRMNKRSADLWYALPIRRDALTLVRVLGGLILVLVPYTVSYWAGFAVIAASENLFELEQYGILFAASLPVGIGLFGVNAFLFTRANTLFDGIVFLLAWASLPMLPFSWLDSAANIGRFFRDGIYWFSPDNYSTFSPLDWLFTQFAGIICGTAGTLAEAPFIYALGAVYAAAAYCGLFLTARRHRAEDVAQVSDSWFGYRVLIPAFMALLLALDYPADDPIGIYATAYAVTLAVGTIAYFVYRRSFRLKLADILCIVGALALGTGIGLLGTQVLGPYFAELYSPLRDGAALLPQALALL